MKGCQVATSPRRSFIRIAIYAVVAVLAFGGCATAPRGGGLTTYSLGGTTYVALIPLCESRGINWTYDTFSKTATLDRSGRTVSLRVGDDLALADGIPVRLGSPVRIHQGTLVVPLRFKEQVIDNVFKAASSAVKVCLATPRIRKVVIDAGHGGNDPGAIGRSGLREKDVTLDIAKRIRALLQSAGFETVLTRSADVAVPLARRTAIANNAGADLFLSIHVNANRVRSLSGFEVYYVSPNANDYQRALTAAQEASLPFLGSSSMSSSQNLKAIVWDMIYANNRAEAIELARQICRSTRETLDTRIIGVKGANFYVLKGTRMPAVLVEIGFLSNSEEERMLRNGSYRQQIASAIAEGLSGYARDCAVMEASR